MFPKKPDYFPYLLVASIAAALFLLLLLDRSTTVFLSPAGMVPFLFIVLAIATTLALFAARAEAPRSEEAVKLWFGWYRAIALSAPDEE